MYIAYGSNNNTLSGNNCSDNIYGIYVTQYSIDNILSNNSCSGNSNGIRLRSIWRCTLEDNNCSDNYAGIYLYEGSYNNTVSNNSCLGNYNGIELALSDNNTIENNTCNSNTVYGIILEGSSCDNALIGNNCSIGESGILVDQSSRNMLSGNNCSSNAHYGIELFSVSPDLSCNNTIVGNWLIDNLQFGVCIWWDCAYNAAYHNVFIGNNGSSGTYDPAHIQAYDEGAGNSWNSPDGTGNWWSDWTGPDVASPLGVVDKTYNISGAAGAKDLYPLCTAFGVIPDVNAPTTSASTNGSSGDNGWYISDASLTLSASDLGSGVDNIAYSLDGGSWTTYSGPVTISTDGVHTIQYRSTDNNQNTEGAKTVTVKVDKTAPTSSAVKNGSAVTLNVTDAVSGLNSTMYRVNGGSWQTYSGVFEVTGAGNNTIEYYSTDNAGNAEAVKTIWVDNGAGGAAILTLELIIIIVVVIAALILVAILMKRRKKSDQQSPPQAPPTP